MTEEHQPFKAKRKSNRAGLTGAAITGINLERLGSAEVLELEWLNVDPVYQRELRHDLVNSIGTGYDIVKAGPILVSERADETLWVVDGQHRVAGALQAGETEIFAHVVRGLTQAQEAELRLARNDRKSDTIQEKFRSRLVMGDVKAHAIVELVHQHGQTVNVDTPLSYKGINAISTLELIYDIDGTGVWLGRTLRCIDEAFGPEHRDPDHYSTSMLKAVCWFLAQHVDSGETPYSEFVERLGSAGVEDLRRKAVSHKAANGGALWINYYRAIVETWNFRRTDARKIQWKTIGSISRLGTAGTRTEVWERGGTAVQ